MGRRRNSAVPTRRGANSAARAGQHAEEALAPVAGTWQRKAGGERRPQGKTTVWGADEVTCGVRMIATETGGAEAGTRARSVHRADAPSGAALRFRRGGACPSQRRRGGSCEHAIIGSLYNDAAAARSLLRGRTLDGGRKRSDGRARATATATALRARSWQAGRYARAARSGKRSGVRSRRGRLAPDVRGDAQHHSNRARGE